MNKISFLASMQKEFEILAGQKSENIQVIHM